MLGSQNRGIRRVVGVKWASIVERPDSIPLPKPSQIRGAKAAGLRYERLFARQFPQSLHGQWFEYEDRSGHGYCQPDLIVSFLPRCLMVFEVKYTLNAEAFLQLNDLYLPVVKVAMNAPVFGCVVARNLVPSSGMVVSDLGDAVSWAIKNGDVPVLHWVGQNVCATHPLKIKFPPPDWQMAFPRRYRDLEAG